MTMIRKLSVIAAVAAAATCAVAADGDSSGKASAGESVLIPLDKAEATIDAIVKTEASGGKPLSPSSEPIAYRYDQARRAYVDAKLGFSKRTPSHFPKLAEVKRFSGMKLEFEERFSESVTNRLAQFSGGEIRWTEDGKTGLSLLASDRKLRDAQIEFIKREMKGRETANKTGTLWILDGDFVFGYAIGLDESRPDELAFVLVVRNDRVGIPAGSFVIFEYMPSQRVLDSVIGSFRGDAASCANVKLLESGKLLTVLKEQE